MKIVASIFLTAFLISFFSACNKSKSTLALSSMSGKWDFICNIPDVSVIQVAGTGLLAYGGHM